MKSTMKRGHIYEGNPVLVHPVVNEVEAHTAKVVSLTVCAWCRGEVTEVCTDVSADGEARCTLCCPQNHEF